MRYNIDILTSLLFEDYEYRRVLASYFPTQLRLGENISPRKKVKSEIADRPSSQQMLYTIN